MNRILRSGSVLLGVVGFLFSCATDPGPVAGGSGTEAGETHGVLLRADGSPLPNHPVLARYQERPLLSARIVDTLTTDSSGRFAITGPAGFYRFLSVQDSQVALSPAVRMVVGTTTVVGSITLSSTRDIHGAVRSPSGVYPATLSLDGTPFPCSWTSLGASIRTFTCAGLPQGSFELLGDGSWLGAFEVGSDTSTTLPSPFWYTPGSVLLETWPEVGWGTTQARRHDLWGLTGSGSWLVVTDGRSSLTPASTNELQQFILRDSVADRNYLQLSYVLDTTVSNPWVQLNVSIGTDVYDLSSLDSLCFVHQGDSKVGVAISRQTTGGSVAVTADPIPAAATWTRSCLALEAWTVTGPDAGDAARDLVRSMNAIRFRPSGGVTWKLSTVELVGIDLPSMLP